MYDASRGCRKSQKAAVRACAYPCGSCSGAGVEYSLLKDGLGLDSLDCVELTLGMEEEFGLVFDDSEEDWMHHFSCLETLSQLVLHSKGE